MTVKSTISFKTSLKINEIIHDSTPGRFIQYLRSSLASLKSRKKSKSPPKTAAIVVGLAMASNATPRIRTAT